MVVVKVKQLLASRTGVRGSQKQGARCARLDLINSADRVSLSFEGRERSKPFALASCERDGGGVKQEACYRP